MDGALQQIGRYRIIGELGRGAMGVVYHATDPAIGRPVAIKTIRIRDIDDAVQREKLRERLFREARSAGVLSHPNIVTIYDMDEVDDLAYIAMAYVNGPTLEKILSTDEPLSGTRMLRILRQTALGLDYAHGKGIVHRDVKPANIMTDEDGSVKITDFGIARLTQGTHSTQTRTVAGTPNYMSPEQVQGLALDGRSDQFSLAVIAYEILTGERPFVGEHLSTIVFKIVAEEPSPAQLLNATLSPQIDQVLRKGLSKKPEGRYPTCSNFVGALELACAESRGWQTLAAGSAAALATVGVERPVAAPAPAIQAPLIQAPLIQAPPPPRVRTAAVAPPAIPERPRKSAFWLAATSALVVGGLAALAVNYEARSTSEPVVPVANESGAGAAAEQPAAEAARSEPPVEQPAEKTAEKPNPLDDPLARPHVDGQEAPPARTIPEETGRAAPEQTARGAQPRIQSIWVTTNPPGAKAVLDGNLQQSCQTPCMLHGVPGVHHIAVSQVGYLNEYRDVSVRDGAVDVPQITLRQPMGTLMLSSSPAGASIRINGSPIPQVTPAVLSLKPGPYSVTVEKDGLSKTEHVDLGDNLIHLSVSIGQ